MTQRAHTREKSREFIQTLDRQLKKKEEYSFSETSSVECRNEGGWVKMRLAGET